MLEKFEEELQTELVQFDIKLIKDVSSNLDTEAKKLKFVKDFVFNEFVNRIEVTKLLRSGYSFAKDSADFYKRMGLVNTPGTKLAIQGFDQNDTQYGMMPQYNGLVIKDFDYSDKDRSDQVVKNLIANGLDPKIAGLYLTTNKSDAQSFISVDMYRGIMQGMGNWTQEDENAYKVYLQGGGYNRPVVPLKPYHEQTNSPVSDEKNQSDLPKIQREAQREQAEGRIDQVAVVVRPENVPGGKARIYITSTANLSEDAQQKVIDLVLEKNYDAAKEIVATSQQRLSSSLELLYILTYSSSISSSKEYPSLSLMLYLEKLFFSISLTPIGSVKYSKVS